MVNHECRPCSQSLQMARASQDKISCMTGVLWCLQLGSPPSTLQVPATPPGINPAPLRNTSVSPMRQDSPDSRRRAPGLSLRQVRPPSA